MGAGRDLRAMRRDGSEFPVEIGLTPVDTPHGLRVVGFAIDISARLESEARLKHSLAELERANESLSRFAYVASHDIQEPLRKISAFGNILRAAMAHGNQEEARYAAEVMIASAQRARILVADLLSLARSLNNAYRLEPISICARRSPSCSRRSRRPFRSKARRSSVRRGFRRARRPGADCRRCCRTSSPTPSNITSRASLRASESSSKPRQAEHRAEGRGRGNRLCGRHERGNLRTLPPPAQPRRHPRQRHRAGHLQDHREPPRLASFRGLDPDGRLDLRDRLPRRRPRRPANA